MLLGYIGGALFMGLFFVLPGIGMVSVGTKGSKRIGATLIALGVALTVAAMFW